MTDRGPAAEAGIPADPAQMKDLEVPRHIGAVVRECSDRAVDAASSDNARRRRVDHRHRMFDARSERRRFAIADDGVATVFACLVLAALIGVTLLIGQVGVVIVGRHRAQAAADLSALSAAGELERGADAGCAAASEIASRMGVRILQCTVVQWDATVTVEGNVPIGLFGKRTVRAVARAGPVEVGV
ncbi:Rv3654c family TadE-like protein [Nocardia sp. NPDC004604]|uniref:Rv3654c family TadE-like protein n=1 Tax=Nocardia sp. NPDC004604 TaxID=3157013 RepID=UPI0033A27E12